MLSDAAVRVVYLFLCSICRHCGNYILRLHHFCYVVVGVCLSHICIEFMYVFVRHISFIDAVWFVIGTTVIGTTKFSGSFLGTLNLGFH